MPRSSVCVHSLHSASLVFAIYDQEQEHWHTYGEMSALSLVIEAITHRGWQAKTKPTACDRLAIINTNQALANNGQSVISIAARTVQQIYLQTLLSFGLHHYQTMIMF